MSRKKNREKRRRKQEPVPAAPAAAPGIGAKGVALWLGLAAMIALVLCVLESVKEMLTRAGGAQ